jgi:hypothetical protein
MRRLAALLAGLIATVGLSLATSAQGEREPQFTGMAASVLTHPEAVRGTDGRFHLAYELVLTNATPYPAEVGRAAVRDAEPIESCSRSVVKSWPRE